MTRSRGRLAALLVLVVWVAVGCAAGPNVAAGPAPEAGFWLGLWHGIIVPITFVVSLFTDDVNIYEVVNDGNWYDFGFVFGLSVSFGGPARSGSAVRRRRRSAASPRRRR
ncbi:hypothetical protein [Blastococcus sp. VKM Ac-2987]|uniref:hypothetical protein n=1 Tax=Blastococcus sp. VKM Ac-2987 TaxID=3004141 RepID=UPI0022AB9800|nr:hypothetical protein [Blastococcus sp. VKM Ac-2987]MCZ2857483.1 hypothetical protein [Blastococcus sp. VKM Ac-2987]